MWSCILVIPVLIWYWLYIKIDPIDHNLLINEQALHLTSKLSKKFRNIISLDKFKKEYIDSQIEKYSERNNSMWSFDELDNQHDDAVVETFDNRRSSSNW